MVGGMTTCRTLADVLAAADADSAAVPPLTQEQADLVAVLLWVGLRSCGRAYTPATQLIKRPRRIDTKTPSTCGF
jgi:hypothetical protein